MIFIRVWGCPLACPWCDEPLHRDPSAKTMLTFEQILTKITQIAPNLPYLLLTGGEPLAMEGIGDLVQSLQNHGYWVAMETSGFKAPTPLPSPDWLTLSPKGYLPETIFQSAHEIKFVLGPNSGTTATTILDRASRHPNVWVQPQAHGSIPDPEAVRQCVALTLAAKGKLRLSLQTHKYIGIP